MLIDNIEAPDGLVHDRPDQYVVTFWRRDVGAKTPYRLREVMSVWEVTRWAEEQITTGDHVGEFAEVCALVAVPRGDWTPPDLVAVPLTRSYWHEVSAGQRAHPEPPPNPATSLPGVD